MSLYEKFLLGLALWTLLEGAFVLTLPNLSRSLSRKLFPKLATFLEDFSTADLRKMAAIEFAFGAILGIYLFLQLR